MQPFLEGAYGNASSVHEEGRRAREAVENARAQVASLIGADAAEIVWTSCATEANALALRGMAESRRNVGRHLVISSVEHPSILGAAEWLEENGYEVSRLAVDETGSLAPDLLARAMRPDTTLVSLMWANNETGVIFPIGDLAEIVRSHGALFHVDAVQAAGRISVDVVEAGADLMTLSGHKMGGPKGVGVLYMRRGLDPAPLLKGGHQERGFRSGTENVPAIVGMGAAVAELGKSWLAESEHVRVMRDRLWRGLSEGVDGVWRNGAEDGCLPNTLNVGFEGCAGDGLLMALDLKGVSASSGSACSSGTVEPSHVLLAMGQTTERARGAVRFSVGSSTTAEEIDGVIGLIPELVERVRGLGEDADWRQWEEEPWME
jgi:cysteine desulfurase